jgi:Cdc6-like AAA superfamily ATPase
MIQQIKTGILWVDAILFGFFIFMIYHGAIVMNFKSVYKKVEVIKNQSIKKNWSYLTNKFKKKSITYTGYMYSSGYRTVSTYVDYPPPMIHVLDYMQKNVYKVENTYNIKYCEVIDVETNTVVKTFIPADEMVSFELYPDIYIELSSDKNIANKEKKSDFIDFSTISFYIKTYEHDISHIHSFLKLCEEKFENSINEQLSKQKYIFKYNSKKSVGGGDQERHYDDGDYIGSRRNAGIKCDEYPLVTNKHLIRNCFFTQRDALIKRIDFFIHNEQWFNERGIPYQLTLVFEGPAGCGKTSTVKGIATYTNRHIVDVDLNGIKDVCELENIFNGTHINGKYIPSNKRIFMIDEIDKFFELLDDREQKERMRLAAAATNKETTNSSIVIVKEGSGGGVNGSTENRFGSNLASTAAAISGCANKTSMNDLTKGQILSIMDGIIEAKGRFIICTANDTSKIDPVFKRPGRMDEFIHFTKCDALMIHQLMDLFYDGTVDEKRVRSKEDLERFQGVEFKLSPSELNKICFNNISSREEGEKRVLESNI